MIIFDAFCYDNLHTGGCYRGWQYGNPEGETCSARQTWKLYQHMESLAADKVVGKEVVLQLTVNAATTPNAMPPSTLTNTLSAPATAAS